MSAMPERVKRYEPDERAEGGVCMVPSEYGLWVDIDDYAALESRLLAAEARAKAMEDGPLDYMSGKCDRLKEQNATLRAERDALVPLARVGLFLRDKLLAGVTNTDLREHLVWCLEEWVVAIDGEDTPRTTKARAILAREAGE